MVASVARGGVWFEVGDAGQNGPGAAQVTIGAGSLNYIEGVLGNSPAGPSDVDVYLISITDYQGFDVYAGGGLDTTMYLFRSDGTGVVMNRENVVGSDYGAHLTSLGLTENGLYYLAIARSFNQPFNSSNSPIFGSTPFAPGTNPIQVQPIAGSGVFDHWRTDVTGPTGGYKLNIHGASFAPAPGALALLGLAGLIGRRRRRA